LKGGQALNDFTKKTTVVSSNRKDHKISIDEIFKDRLITFDDIERLSISYFEDKKEKGGFRP